MRSNMQGQCSCNSFVLLQVSLKTFTQFLTQFIKPMLNLQKEPEKQGSILPIDTFNISQYVFEPEKQANGNVALDIEI